MFSSVIKFSSFRPTWDFEEKSCLSGKFYNFYSNLFSLKVFDVNQGPSIIPLVFPLYCGWWFLFYSWFMPVHAQYHHAKLLIWLGMNQGSRPIFFSDKIHYSNGLMNNESNRKHYPWGCKVIEFSVQNSFPNWDINHFKIATF